MKFLRGETLVSVSSSPNSGLEFSYSFRKGFHGNKRIHLVQHALGQWFCPTESTNQLRPTCPSTISRCFFTASSSTSNILNIHSSPTSPASCKNLLPVFTRPSELSFSRWYFYCDPCTYHAGVGLLITCRQQTHYRAPSLKMLPSSHHILPQITALTKTAIRRPQKSLPYTNCVFWVSAGVLPGV